MMKNYAKMSVVTLFAGAAVMAGSAAPASASTQVQDGLVNVAVGDITIQDINVGVAATIVAQVCGVKVGPLAVLGTAIDAGGPMRTVCESNTGPVTISQN